MSDIVRDTHAGPVPQSAWEADDRARTTSGRVEIFNATRPGGLDGWTVDLSQHEAVRGHILDVIDDEADADGTIPLETVAAAAQEGFGDNQLFPYGSLHRRASRGSSPRRTRGWRIDDA